MLLDTFFDIVRAGLWHKQAPTISSLTPEEWNALFTLASEQAITPTFIEGIAMLDEANRPGLSIRTKWLPAVVITESSNEKMEDTIKKLFDHYKSMSIRPVLMKGQGLAMNWTYPKHRMPGDIDVFFPDIEQSAKADAWAKKVSKTTIDDYEERNIGFTWEGVSIENHNHIYIFANKQYNLFFEQIVTDTFAEDAHHSFVTLSNGYEVEVIPPTLNFLYQVIHITRHLYNQGIGVRQLADIAYFAERYHEEIDINLLQKYTDTLRLSNAVSAIGAFVTERLGLDENKWPLTIIRSRIDNEICQDIINGGNFGKKRFIHKEKQSRRGSIMTSMFMHAGRHWKYRNMHPGEIFPDYMIKFKHVVLQWKKGKI